MASVINFDHHVQASLPVLDSVLDSYGYPGRVLILGFQTNCYSWRSSFISAAETACHRKCLFLGY